MQKLENNIEYLPMRIKEVSLVVEVEHVGTSYTDTFYKSFLVDKIDIDKEDFTNGMNIQLGNTIESIEVTGELLSGCRRKKLL